VSGPCQAWREELDGALVGGVSLELRAHLAHCADCSSGLARRREAVAALRGLPRRAAPRLLAGRVVAALNAGARQERAVAAVAALERRAAPSELDARLAELLASPANTVERFARGAADGRAAPDELFERVDGDLRRGRVAGAGPLRRLAIVVAGALAVVAIFHAWPAGGAVKETGQVEIVLVEVGSARELDPLTRALFEGVTGGATGEERL
jgi:hypothetical protein